MSNTTLTVLTQASLFLTQPLLLTYSASQVLAFHQLLISSMSLPYFSAMTRGSKRLILTLSPSVTPPRPVHAVCIAAGIKWAEWISILGGREFDLILERDAVSVRVPGKTCVVWAALETTRKPAQQEAPAAPTTASSLRMTLLNSVFARRSKIDASSPLAISLTPSEDSDFSDDEEISRPSSRSSFTSSASSVSTGATSIVSSEVPFCPPGLSAKQAAVVPKASAVRRPTAPVVASNNQGWQHRAPSAPSPVVVNTTKADVTRFLYQGGVSTVLGGGVMLASPASASPKSTLTKSPNAWRPRAAGKA